MDKKNLMAPYQQSFRIDDLLTRKATEQQQPGRFCPPPPLHNTLQSPPLGQGGGTKMEKGLGNLACQPNGKSFNGLANENGSSNCEEDVNNKRTYSSTSNEEDDDIYRKRKKARTAFSREQVADLEKKFQEKKYLSSAERGELAEKLKLSDMQVKTWFQNRRMKYKRQSEEAEMEMKSPKYPYSSFVSYGGMGPLYGYVPMPYKAHDGGSGLSVPYTYATSALRSPQQTTSPITGSAMDVNFVMNHSSPSMLGPLPSPLSAGMSPRHSFPTPLPRPNGTSSYFNGLLTPISPSTGYQHSYFNTNEGVGSVGNHTHVQGFSDWPRAIPAPTTP